MSEVDEIKSRLDILDVVSLRTQLQKSGRSYRALCPFHTEKTPSFHVFPERQSWRCFGACATGGDIFSFVMRVENLDFSDALKLLAQQAGVKLAEKRRRSGEGDVLHQINEAAREYFCRLLESDKDGSRARDYLVGRNITHETIEKFQIGLSPADGKSLREYLAAKGYTQAQMALAGAVTGGESDGYRDMFRRRLMIPIRDSGGMLAGFGGRTLDDSSPKYLNTPRSPVFDKSDILYALNFAKGAVREMGSVVIVEGYMDAMIAHQHGFSNVVASMGTALTPRQVSQVKAFIRGVGSSQPGAAILALDPDIAGQEATLRSLETSWNVFQAKPVGHSRGATLYERPEVPSLKVVPLPVGKDPADVITESPQVWAQLLVDAQPMLDFLFAALSSRLDLNSPQGKGRLAELLFPLIAASPDPFQQDHYFQRLASLLGVSEATLQASLGRGRQRGGNIRRSSRDSNRGGQMPTGRRGSDGGGAATTPFDRLDHDPLEEYYLALVLQNPDLSGHSLWESSESPAGEPDPVSSLRLEYFNRVENREVFTKWLKCSTLDTLRETLDADLQEHLERLVAKELPPSDRKQRETALWDCVRRLEERHLRDLKREEGLRLSQASAEQAEEQQQDILRLNERLKRIL